MSKMCTRNPIGKLRIIRGGFDAENSEKNPLLRPNSQNSMKEKKMDPIENKMEGYGSTDDELRMHLENELNALRERRNCLWTNRYGNFITWVILFGHISLYGQKNGPGTESLIFRTNRRKPTTSADCFQFYKISRSGNWAKCRICGRKISRAARQSNLALLGHLQLAHSQQLEMEEQFMLLEMALNELNGENGTKEGNGRK